MCFSNTYLQNPAEAITTACAHHLLQARNEYNYPGAKMQFAPPGTPAHITIGGRGAIFVPPLRGSWTDLALDVYHQRLLTSGTRVDRLLGLASVVYWGFITHNDPLARVRVNWLLHGHGGRAGANLHNTEAALLESIDELAARRFGTALNSLNGISQLSRTPFGSKVIAFLSPDQAGVYDNRIMNGLNNVTWSITQDLGARLRGGVGNTNEQRVKQRYHNWCLFLQRVATQLNHLGGDYQWQCTELTPQAWRAIDVERALFQLLGAQGRQPNDPL